MRLPGGGGGIACSFSNAGKVCDVQGVCVETQCTKVEEEVAKRQREKEKAERAKLREERRQALVEAGEIGSDESITNSWEVENEDEEDDEEEEQDEEDEEEEEGRDNGGSSSKVIDRDVMESGAGETKDSAGSPKKGMIGSLFGGFKAMMNSSPAEHQHVVVPRLNVSGFVAWLTVEKGKKARNLAETLAQFGAIAVIVECDAAQWEEEEEEDAEGGPVPIVHVPARKGERLAPEGSLGGNIVGVEFYRQLGGEGARGVSPGWDSQLEQFGIVSSNLEPPQAPPPPEPVMLRFIQAFFLPFSSPSISLQHQCAIPRAFFLFPLFPPILRWETAARRCSAGDMYPSCALPFSPLLIHVSFTLTTPRMAFERRVQVHTCVGSRMMKYSPGVCSTGYEPRRENRRWRCCVYRANWAARRHLEAWVDWRGRLASTNKR